MKKSILLLFVWIVSIFPARAQAQTGTEHPSLSQNEQTGAITYKINRRSNMIEYPFGYSQPILKTTPLRLSLIILQKGEEINSISGGDTDRWYVTKAYQGDTGNVTPVVQVKPRMGNISTNLIITTDKRTYDIALEAPDIDKAGGNPREHFTRRISFYYPEEENFSDVGTRPEDNKSGDGAGQAAPANVNPERGVIDLSKTNMAYRTKKGKHGFPWEPVAIYDNGKQVFIKIPDIVEAPDLPAFYIVNQAGEQQNVNFSLDPTTNTLTIDHIFRKGVFVKKFTHKGFLGLGTQTSERQLFVIRK